MVFFTGFAGGSFDLCDHYLLITTYSCVVSELLKLLEELITVLVVHLSEFLHWAHLICSSASFQNRFLSFSSKSS